MKTIAFAAAAFLALGAATLTPAFAADNGTPFDVGSSHYPNVVGRPGTDLVGLGNSQLLPVSGNESPVQTSNSLPNDFTVGTSDYAQAKSTDAWLARHGQPSTTLAAR